MSTSPIVPETSTTLLRDVADVRHARWSVFVARYEPMMRTYVRTRFPTLDADEIVQSTFVELAHVLPEYIYAPEEKGRFHNYLTGILRHKALRQLRAAKRDAALKESVAEMPSPPSADPEEDAYRQSLVDLALARFFADDSVASRTKEVFRCVAVKGEPPETVARAYRVERHAVDQIKSRSLEKVRAYIAELEATDA